MKPTIKPRGSAAQDFKKKLGKSKQPSVVSVLKALLNKPKSQKANRANSEGSRIEPSVHTQDATQDQTEAVGSKPDMHAPENKEQQRKDKPKESKDNQKSSKKKKTGFLTKRVKQKTNTMNLLNGGHNPAYLLVQEIKEILGPSKTVSAQEPTLILSTIDNKPVYWSLSDSGAKIVTEVLPGQTALSFTNEDFRIAAAKTMSNLAAAEDASRETGLKCNVVNLSSTQFAIYATPKERSELLAQKMRLVPGSLVLDRLLKRKSDQIDVSDDEHLIFGLQFPKEENPQAFAAIVLCSRNQGGEISEPQVSINPDSVDFLINQYAATKKIPRGKAKVVLFSFEEYKQISDELARYAYPADPEFFGVPVKKILAGALIISAGIAGYSMSMLTLDTVLMKNSQQSAMQAKALSQKYSQAVKSIASDHPVELARLFSKNMSGEYMLEKVSEAYIPTSRISAEVRNNEINIQMKVPVMVNGLQVLHNETVSSQDLQSILGYEPPSECQKNKTVFTEDLNEVVIQVTCHGANTLANLAGSW